MRASDTIAHMKQVVVASTNPAKLQAVTNAFRRLFPDEVFNVVGIVVDSGVPDQPTGDVQTRKGAGNRVANVRAAVPTADFWVGVEGGIQIEGGQTMSYAWIAIAGADGRNGLGKTGIYFLPPKITKLLQDGLELGHATDKVFGINNSKHSSGAVGVLTGGHIDRSQYYAEAVILALMPFKNPTLYPAR